MPWRIADPMSMRLELLCAARHAHPTWGARKRRAALEVTHPTLAWPAASTPVPNKAFLCVLRVLCGSSSAVPWFKLCRSVVQALPLGSITLWCDPAGPCHSQNRPQERPPASVFLRARRLNVGAGKIRRRRCWLTVGLPAPLAVRAPAEPATQPLAEPELEGRKVDSFIAGGITTAGCPHAHISFSTFSASRDRFVMHTVQALTPQAVE